ncbi:MAG TPA: hypothetical protein VLS86_11200, partial [Acidimicrobiia bacterium]|nr:hypothetical protein [Acidimicrobiia bacterium]
VGSVEGGSFQLVTAAITGLGSSPEGVPTGSGGLATGDNSLLLPIALAGLALAGVAAGSVALARREG